MQKYWGLLRCGRKTLDFKLFLNLASGLLIWSLHEGRDGILWVGTGGGHLSRFDPATETFTPYRHRELAPQFWDWVAPVYFATGVGNIIQMVPSDLRDLPACGGDSNKTVRQVLESK